MSNYSFYWHDIIDSSNNEAIRMLEGGQISGPFVVVAGTQTAGRGRFGRSWVSCSGNLMMTIVRRVEVDYLPNISCLPLISAVAIGDFLNSVLSNKCKFSYKWPNDILVEDKKISGVLVELVRGKDAAEWYVVVGVGVNIYSAPESIDMTACLKDFITLSVDLKPMDLAQGLSRVFENNYVKWTKDGFGNFQDAWMKSAYGLGRHVRVLPDLREGIFRGIDESGKLLLEHNDNLVTVIDCRSLVFV